MENVRTYGYRRKIKYTSHLNMYIFLQNRFKLNRNVERISVWTTYAWFFFCCLQTNTHLLLFTIIFLLDFLSKQFTAKIKCNYFLHTLIKPLCKISFENIMIRCKVMKVLFNNFYFTLFSGKTVEALKCLSN